MKTVRNPRSGPIWQLQFGEFLMLHGVHENVDYITYVCVERNQKVERNTHETVCKQMHINSLL